MKLQNKLVTPVFQNPKSNPSVKSTLRLRKNSNIGLLQGYTPLMLASQNGNLAVVKRLVSSGADINATDFDVSDSDMHHTSVGWDKNMACVQHCTVRFQVTWA